MADLDASQRRPISSATVLARRWPLVLLLAIPIAVGAVVGVRSLGRTYEAVAVVTFSPRADVLVAGDVLRLTIPRYATLATADSTFDAARASLGLDSDTSFDVRAEIPPETTNLFLTVNGESADLTAAIANDLARQVVDASERDDLLTSTLLVAAEVPDDTSGPPLVLLYPVAILAALAISAAIVLVIDLVRPRVWTPADVRTLTRAAVLGVIPSARSVRSDPIWTGDHGAVADHVRALRWQTESLRVADRVPVLVVTSPTDGDGKSTVAALLAGSLAQGGRRVALVDGDFGSPSLTDRLSRAFSPRQSVWGRLRRRAVEQPEWLPRPQTLVETARDPLAISEHWWRPSVANLMFLPAAAESSGGTSLAPYVEDLFEALRFEKDWVVVDAPALFGGQSAEVLARSADMVILVVSGGSHRRAVKAASNVLAGLGAPLAGVVVNRSNDLPD